MISYQGELRGMDEQIEKLVKYEQIAALPLERAIFKSVVDMQGTARQEAPVFRGILRNSIDTEVKDEGRLSIVGRVFSNLRSEVYPAVMEAGRAPGSFPPIEPLKRWAHLVLGDERLAYPVARAIARRGIKGRFFMKKAYDKNKTGILAHFKKALDEITEALSVRT